MESNVQLKFNLYPEPIQPLLFAIRALIFDIAAEQNLGDIEETLKWGEPSYLVKTGSTVRIDWKPKSPDQYFIFFNCKTKLIDTFRELHSDVLEFQGNRAIVLNVNSPLPISVIRQCLELSLNYKRVKHLPLLGA
ncbi:DUF1801 domain-containing protein [Vibrio rumoiensis]|uniref:YdhG-like domain-containing protein n=1 Tax=Vibrio rumoiensis 1S-45 TaxID=1188252 RepID=A0A1E5E660_9VIBR|nr:DUF1801 domain-containing protein [Vibrio rumoiensis]OEF29512.1 hypothetical protein A1QC_14070 [Vibrio rumoiensis 1S-45]